MDASDVMVKRIARIKNGAVTNVEVWPDGVVLDADMVDVTDQRVGPGFAYDGADFSEPAPPPDPRAEDEKAIDTILEKNRSTWTAADQRRLIEFTAKQLRGRA